MFFKTPLPAHGLKFVKILMGLIHLIVKLVCCKFLEVFSLLLFSCLSWFEINGASLSLINTSNSQWCIPPMYNSSSRWRWRFWQAEGFL